MRGSFESAPPGLQDGDVNLGVVLVRPMIGAVQVAIADHHLRDGEALAPAHRDSWWLVNERPVAQFSHPYESWEPGPNPFAFNLRALRPDPDGVLLTRRVDCDQPNSTRGQMVWHHAGPHSRSHSPNKVRPGKIRAVGLRK